MKKAMMAALIGAMAMMFSGCAGKIDEIKHYFGQNKLVVCEAWEPAGECPKPLSEFEASDYVGQAGVISKQVKTCKGYIENNITVDSTGFICEDFFD